MIEYVTGDLLGAGEEHIAHGCNVVGVMGAGVARVIAEKYPVVRHQYQRRCVKHEFILGSAFPVLVPQGDTPTGTCTVWNLGTQRDPGPNGSMWGILLAFGNMFEQMREWEVHRVAIPRIGCGIAGLRWDAVERQIQTALHFLGDYEMTVVVYTQLSQEGVSW